MSLPNNYFFVDESGDPTFFNKNGRVISGTNDCSPILIIGFIRTDNPSEIRKAIANLHQEIKEDEYLKSIPSISKTNLHFHAKDDCPEVREKVFKLIKKLDFKAEFIVARKRLDVFTKRHKKNEDIFYNEIVTKLFEKKLHQKNNIIYFSKRGTKTKQQHLSQAIRTAVLNFEEKHNTQVETQTKIYIQTPSDEPCLQIIDYMNWIIYRAYTKKEVRYFEFLQEKISFVCDIYDFDKYPKNFYNRKNIFDIKKISPLGLESN
jgi:hypothetical protein